MSEPSSPVETGTDPVDEAVSPEGAAPAAPATAPPSRYSLGSMSNLARSLLVIVGLVAVLIAIVPRISSVDQPAVDAASVVSNAVTQSGLALEAPVGLPAGWKATSARYAASTDDIVTWQGGWTTPDDGFVGIRQASAVTPKWIDQVTSSGQVVGSVQLAGRTWEKRYDSQNDQTSLVDEHDGALTTVITAKAPDADISTFTTALQVAKPSS